MSIILKELFIWQKVYAQENIITLDPCQLADDGTVWNTWAQSCLKVCTNWYVQSWWVDTNECRKTCTNWYTEKNGIKQNECLENGTDNLGINCDATQLINGTCHRNINKTLGVRQSDTTPNPTVLLQDIVLAATSFVGTLIMIALIVMGVKYVKWWYDESSTGDLKGNIRKLLIWLFLVIGSYTIIRLIQYVARWY